MDYTNSGRAEPVKVPVQAFLLNLLNLTMQLHNAGHCGLPG